MSGERVLHAFRRAHNPSEPRFFHWIYSQMLPKRNKSIVSGLSDRIESRTTAFKQENSLIKKITSRVISGI